MGRFIDRTGEKVGRLTIIRIAGHDKFNRLVWECKCDCGNTKNIVGCHINQTHTISCGCYNREKNYGKARHTTHGKCKTRIYREYRGIISRCTNQSLERYNCYGGRGISVCEEWLGKSGFMNFYNWSMENGYSDELTIDRIDVNGNYEPSNCRWATIDQQANNKRSNIVFELDGEKLTLKQISRKYGVDYKMLFARIKYLGWDIERAISTPVRKLSRKANNDLSN